MLRYPSFSQTEKNASSMWNKANFLGTMTNFSKTHSILGTTQCLGTMTKFLETCSSLGIVMEPFISWIISWYTPFHTYFISITFLYCSTLNVQHLENFLFPPFRPHTYSHPLPILSLFFKIIYTFFSSLISHT
jgi:hypothetical protein